MAFSIDRSIVIIIIIRYVRPARPVTKKILYCIILHAEQCSFFYIILLYYIIGMTGMYIQLYTYIVDVQLLYSVGFSVESRDDDKTQKL